MKTIQFRAFAVILGLALVAPAIPGHAAGKPAKDAPAAKEAGKPVQGAKPAAAKPVTLTPTPAAPAAPAAPSGPPGKLEIKETAYDAGTVDRGTDITHAFEIKNVGTGTLTVEAKPGCGCTVVDYDKTVAPGATGKVTASVHTTNFKGDITKSITITTNDPDKAQTILQIKAKVKVPVNVEPETVSLDGKPGEIAPTDVMVTASEGEAFDIVSADSSDPHFKATVTPVMEAEAGKPAPKAPKAKTGTIASGSKAYKVSIATAKDTPIARTNATITLKTTHPKAADLTIRIFANLRGNITVAPERLTFRLGPTSTEADRVQHVVIRKNGTEGPALKVTSATSSAPQFKTTLKPNTNGQDFDLEVKYEGEPPTGVVSEKITIKTNDTMQPSVELLVYAMAMPAAQQGQAIQVQPVMGTAADAHAGHAH